MKLLIVALALTGLSASAHADQYVNGYYRNNGTYVQPYNRTDSNSSVYDNYSTRGNVNPYTGQPGTVNPYPSYQQPSYGNYGVNNLNRRGY